MIRKALISIVSLTALLLWAGAAAALTPEESFKKDFPDIPYQSMRPATIAGLYEMEMPEGRVVYYVPATGNVILGRIITKDGRNLTLEREAEIASRKIKDIPLEQALKIGSGSHKIIEFTDPDCPYCREAAKFLITQTDVTRYIFFVPLGSHPDAVPKVRYIHCATDKAKAYEEAMTGKLDEMKFALCENENVDKTMKAQEEIIAKLRISSTPTFFIDGTMVTGADIPTIKRLLSKAVTSKTPAGK